jgi:uncharacterized protein YbaA (DUF1428 family)
VAYIEGFVAAVPTANEEDYVKHARDASKYFQDLGATRVVECWGDDVPKGEVTDFYKAAQVRDDETPIFSWIEYALSRRTFADRSPLNAEGPSRCLGSAVSASGRSRRRQPKQVFAEFLVGPGLGRQ